MNRLFILCLLIIAGTNLGFAQETPPPTQVNRPVLDSYEPDEENLYGSLNPSAPAETSEFEFMIGTFDCTDLIREPNSGKWYQSKSVWTSKYILNGTAIQDSYWSPITVATSTRVFDAKKKKWIVTYLQTTPGYGAGVWEGEKEGKNMVMRQKRGANESRLTFSNITADGFDWIGENVAKDSTTSGWKISCTRRQKDR